MEKNNFKYKKGFMALMSVILISGILMLVTVTLSASTLYERFALQDNELKERSLANAEACANQGILLIADNISHPATTTIKINNVDPCDLGVIPGSGDPRVFYVKSNTKNFYTNLKISVSPYTLSVNSWEEIATY